MKLVVGEAGRPARSRGGWVLLLLTLLTAAALGALYLLPEKQRTVNELYSAVDTRVANSLQRFRTDYPYSELDVGGVVWRYIRGGEGAEVVLMLHDLVGSADVWWQVASALDDEYTVLLPTLPPLGSLESLTAGIQAVLDEEQIHQVHVVGTSLGGHLGQYLLSVAPERVQTLILGNAFPPSDGLAAEFGPWAAAARYVPPRLVRRSILETLESDWLPASGSSELLRAYLAEQVGHGSPRRLLARYRLATEPFLPPDPAQHSTPVFILESVNDPVVSSELRAALRQTYPGARVVSLGPVGHYPMITRPAQYVEALREALGGTLAVNASP